MMQGRKSTPIIINNSLSDIPEVDLRPIKKRSKQIRPRYITESEYEQIIAIAPTERDRLLIQLMWQSGGRVSEVCALRRRDINEADRSIRLVNLKQGAYAEKDVFVGETLIANLLDYCIRHGIEPDAFVFRSRRARSEHLGRKMAYRIVISLTEQLGIRKPHADGVSKPAWPHCIRHGAAVNLLKKTHNIQVVKEQLGHANVATTSGYLNLLAEERKSQLKGVFN